MKLTYKFKNSEAEIGSIDKKEYLDPEKVYIYLKNGDRIKLEDGDKVKENELVRVSYNNRKTYSPISGTCHVTDNCVEITNDHKKNETKEKESLKSFDDIDRNKFMKLLHDVGDSVNNHELADYFEDNYKLILVNGCDIEPYQFNIRAIIKDHAEEICETIGLISKIFNVDVDFVLTSSDPNLKKVSSESDRYNGIKVTSLNEGFPYTLDSLLKDKLYPQYSDKDVLILDPLDIYKIYKALKYQLPVTERYVTVSYADKDRVYVVKTKYGVSLKEILSDILPDDPSNHYIYLNNFMRKTICTNLDLMVVADQVRAVFIVDNKGIDPIDCIKCGKCVQICPIDINPMASPLSGDCIRCGLCNFVCPSNINLLEENKKEHV